MRPPPASKSPDVRAPTSGPPPAIETPQLSYQGRLSGRRVTLGVCGSIAAYKAAQVARLLLKEGAEVQTVLTASAERFVGAATFGGLTGRPALTTMWNADTGGELHVDLAARSDLLLIVPATADMLARLATGRADDLLTATALCARCPVLVAPAMHPRMWSHPATLRNVSTLEHDGRVHRIGPVDGEVASGESGFGRMAEPEHIVAAAASLVCTQDLAGRHVVVTAGPTVEDLDPVRFVSNRSSGKMGFAIAERAVARGAKVTLVTGPVSLPVPYGVQLVEVRSAVAMRGAVWQALGPDLGHADALVMTAAVGDYRPAEAHAAKLKRESKRMTLELVQNPDILAEIGAARRTYHPILVGFAVETDGDEQVIAHARTKLEKKRVDLVVANHASDSFGRDDNRATLVAPDQVDSLGRLAKTDLADQILDWVAARFLGIG
jgi:phosphopantothenoylcysteine decarboxylase/phosphopantothenate--cysteine ligase